MKFPLFPPRVHRSGFALVVVLSVLALLVLLAVGFLIRAGMERVASSSYQSSVNARQMGDTVLGLVQGQINLATTQGTSVAYATQPGLVRTFDASGNLLHAYKLYSAETMIADQVVDASGNFPDQPPSTWASDPATWTDLNAPVEIGGSKFFPIMDPPVPADGVKGYALGTPPGTPSTYQPVPMPVRWLYMLKSGKLIAPTGTGATGTITGATKSDPVVGRVAFWTDDETCKVNVNTASEGTYFDTPRGESTQEHNLGNFQPAQKEFQRYPGHPAMTSLSAVFANLTPAQIFDIVPRVVGGGSNAGTVMGASELTPDTDRLYASLDEILLNPTRSAYPGLVKDQIRRAKFLLTAHSRAPETNLFNLPRIACWPLFKDLATGRVTAFDQLIAFCSSTGAAGQRLPYYFQREKADSPTNDFLISRNAQLYKYLQKITSQPVPGFGGDFATKYGADRDQILTEIFDYIRCSNMHDDLLGGSGQFTNTWTSGNINAIPAGFGWVAPINDSATNSADPTMGLGRTFTLSELGIAFICNAVADDPATTGVDESYGSNIATGDGQNAVLGGMALNTGEKYIQAIIVPEMFSPMLGYVALASDLVLEIGGLDGLTVATAETPAQNLYPGLISGNTRLGPFPPAFYNARIWGGNPSWRYFSYLKGSPIEGSLPGDNIGDKTTGSTKINDLYPFVGVPVKIKAPATGTSTMTFGGSNLTVRLYARTKSPANLIQTFQITLPNGTFPIPNLVNKSISKSGHPVTTPEDWWSFAVKGCILDKNGNPLKPDGTPIKPGRLFYTGEDAGGSGTIGSSSGPAAAALLVSNTTDKYDVIRTVLPAHGDFRLSGTSYAANNTFVKHPRYDDVTSFAASCLSSSAGTTSDQGFDNRGKYISTLTYASKWQPDIPYGVTVANTPESTGDYDNAIGRALDGPLANKPDEGATTRITGRDVYFDDSGVQNLGGTARFSPNRQMPSPGMFGSLPTGVKAGVPWRTLLFRPQPTHFGARSPSDHLWLDLFWMPVVEPYAISDRFSTAGKINMNYQILPFSYIKRSTGLQALLKSEKVVAIPNKNINFYKSASGTSLDATYRLDIDPDITLGQFDTRFSQGKLFKSASEICDLHIVPKGRTLAEMNTFWGTNATTGYALTGDNSRERIYTTLYPRLTTKSNTFTIHFRVQSLKKVTNSTADKWTEGKDSVTGEYRGATIIERFIDANNSAIPDYADDGAAIPGSNTLDKFYRWRVVQNRQFAP